jgi:S-adenosylmethionine:tRNA ribosyltransferase-isomerase
MDKKQPVIPIDEYRYELPDERIARYPLTERDAAKLLLWRNGSIQHHAVRDLRDLLSGNETLFFNNTKVIPARMYFRKATGALIEVFLLRPIQPVLVEQAMRARREVQYECAIGNLKAWKGDTTLTRSIEREGQTLHLQLELLDRDRMLVRFSWDAPEINFAQIIELAGEAPLPPYLQRAAEDSDKTRYQTVYSKKEGAVAAPTAGLHFTPELIEALQAKGVQMEELTLHVSAGTFRPVKTDNALDHDMHTEQVIVRRSNVEALLRSRPIVAVGTTSLRTLESIYWLGVLLLEQPDAEFVIDQYLPARYAGQDLPTLATAAGAVLARMDRENSHELFGDTQIYIYPGYQFRVCDALMTNFHQPGSTLMLLVAAFTGGDAWKDIYKTALAQDYRFLSFGDSSLLFRLGTGS